MGKNTKIGWCDHTFNAWRGCTKVSEGCKHCYAEINTPSRVARAKGIETWGKNAARIVTGKAQWNQVRLWNKKAEGWLERPRVFLHSLSDVFEDYKGGNVCDHEGVKLHETLAPVRMKLFKLISECPNLDFLMLTKRPESIRGCISEARISALLNGYNVTAIWLSKWLKGQAPDNVWLGTSVENQCQAQNRIPYLIDTPAKIKFLSCEPLLGELNLYDARAIESNDSGAYRNIDWVICGGESGSNHRPMMDRWAESLKYQCDSAGIPFFMKQLGGHPDKRDNFDLFPDELKVQEFPV